MKKILVVTKASGPGFESPATKIFSHFPLLFPDPFRWESVNLIYLFYIFFNVMQKSIFYEICDSSYISYAKKFSQTQNN